ncbi:MAG: sodium:calcium antiporter [Promethearchaeota archaeon]|jgi:cation:H+ antiporter
MLLFSILLLTLGFLGLYFGAKFVIISLENIADRLNISHIMVGLTILSIGTSLPEIAVSVMGGIDKILGINPNIDGIVIGNKIGSFLTQITLIIGILAISQPIFVSKWELRREGPMLFISILIFLFFSLDGVEREKSSEN